MATENAHQPSIGSVEAQGMISPELEQTYRMIGGLLIVGALFLFLIVDQWRQPQVPPILNDPGPMKLLVNESTAHEFALLPGIGPKLSKRIVDYRQTHGPFDQFSDLTEVEGIGPITLERIRPWLMLDSDGEAERHSSCDPCSSRGT